MSGIINFIFYEVLYFGNGNIIINELKLFPIGVYISYSALLNFICSTYLC